ncbi:MAG: 1-deoxy-D-xylulose-5-phosphate reductoisomerase [Candidatus Diapherotrites archaeon]|nr:1-deoxy-D-xylulose-5-phosphate reductoisomerase [Candidatus Diapherotrites archaeon]
MQRLIVLGSTGSIGTQTLDLVSRHKARFKVVALACKSNIELLQEQIEKFKPERVAVADEEKAEELKAKVDCEIVTGENAAADVIDSDADIVVNALVGFAGLRPTLKALEKVQRLALANKESLVVAGDLVKEYKKKFGRELLPIDSEHCAIWECLRGSKKEQISKLILTASGGAFRDKSKEELQKVKARDALKHPTWSMGAKITIDSATLMNKGFEVMEAHFLFDMPYEQIDVVMHPQSIVHSMVEFVDGSVIAQLSKPDMRLAIATALAYPERIETGIEKLDFVELGQLIFREIRHDVFPAIKLAFKVGKLGGTLPTAMNAANEIAVEAFLNDKIPFLKMYRIIEETTFAVGKEGVKYNLEDIFETDKKAREYAKKIVDENA